MTRFAASALLLLLSSLPSAQAKTGQRPGRAAPCPAPFQDTVGYSSAADMNADQQDEITLAMQEGVTAESYVYTLCPGAFLDMRGEPLQAVLDGASFVCGPTGARSGNCTLWGGNVQVVVDELFRCTAETGECGFSNGSPNSSETSVEFTGVTFQGFTEAAVSGLAGPATTVAMTDVVFEVSLHDMNTIIYHTGALLTHQPLHVHSHLDHRTLFRMPLLHRPTPRSPCSLPAPVLVREALETLLV